MNLQAQKEALFSSGAWRWYQARELRERQILAIGGAILLLLLVWAIVWSPVSDWYEVESARYVRAQENLDWMRSHQKEASALASTPNSGAQRPLLSIVSRSAKAHNLAIARFQPEGESLTVSLQNQVFSDVLRWLQALQENNGVLIRSLTIDRQDSPGYVNARISFQ